jgi:2-keto-4-pentenoate hydratase
MSSAAASTHLRKPRARTLVLGMGLGLLGAVAATAACLSEAEVAALADAYQSRMPAANPQGLSPADGECSRSKFNRLLQAQMGEPVGYKAGLTNPAVQKRFNHGSPVWGALYGPMMLANGSVVDAAFGARPLFEADLLVRVSSDAVNGARSPMEVLSAIDRVIPAVELPDLIVQAPAQLDGAAITAINVGARYFIQGLGIPVPATRGERYQLLDALREMVVIVKVDGTEIDRGLGADVMGHPLNAVAWLAQDMARNGLSLKVGDLVSLGSFSRLHPPQAGQKVEVSFWGLPGTPAVTLGLR